eukprot:4241877-Pyramimonas_sp.AAC.4
MDCQHLPSHHSLVQVFNLQVYVPNPFQLLFQCNVTNPISYWEYFTIFTICTKEYLRGEFSILFLHNRQYTDQCVRSVDIFRRGHFHDWILYVIQACLGHAIAIVADFVCLHHQATQEATRGERLPVFINILEGLRDHLNHGVGLIHNTLLCSRHRCGQEEKQMCLCNVYSNAPVARSR